MKKVFLFFSLLTIAFALFGVVVRAGTDEFLPDRKIDGGLMLREERSDPEYLEEAKATISESAKNINLYQESAAADGNFTYNGGTKYFLGYELEFIAFTLRSVGPNVEVWVANDLGYGYNNPYGPDEVTQEQVDRLRDEFESNIRPTVRDFFGNEDFHDGSNSVLEQLGYLPQGYYANPEGKILILVENIKDESYYMDVNVYIAGFYWQALEYYHDLNIVTIDSYAWFALMPNDNPAWQEYQYDVFGTLAHEYQHLIHADNDPAEEKWLNEGMSDFTQFLCGYGHNRSHIDWFLHFPENSLLEWGDYDGTEILADYGQAYLLQLYISEQFGREFVRTLATHPKQGIESVNEVLKDFGTRIDFEELFRRFTIAVALDTNEVGNGIYEFKSIDLAINYEYAEYYDKEGVPIYGADYSILNFEKCLNRINFTMGDYFPMAWQVVEGEYLWSNTGFAIDNALIFEADLRKKSKATLVINHFYEIEEQWDYGFVQVSVDKGKTWVSLKNTNTRSDFLNWEDFPEIGAQLPGLTGSSGYVEDVFNLTPFAGKKVLISFRYMTDQYVSEGGWFIDSIAIPEINYFNDCSSLNGFMDFDRLYKEKIEYTLVFIFEYEVCKRRFFQIVSIEGITSNCEKLMSLLPILKKGTCKMIAWSTSVNPYYSSVPFTFEIRPYF
jgi:hypothetical protein